MHAPRFSTLNQCVRPSMRFSQALLSPFVRFSIFQSAAIAERSGSSILWWRMLGSKGPEPFWAGKVAVNCREVLQKSWISNSLLTFDRWKNLSSTFPASTKSQFTPISVVGPNHCRFCLRVLHTVFIAIHVCLSQSLNALDGKKKTKNTSSSRDKKIELWIWNFCELRFFQFRTAGLGNFFADRICPADTNKPVIGYAFGRSELVTVCKKRRQ